MVVELDEFLYALLVDQVEEVVPLEGEPALLRTELLPGWARTTQGDRGGGFAEMCRGGWRNSGLGTSASAGSAAWP